MQVLLEDFKDIYNLTYNQTLKYIICKCSNIEDVNDLIQDTYVELYKILKRKKKIEVENISNYIIGIAKKQIFRYYGKLYKTKEHIVFSNSDILEDTDIPLNFDLEDEIFTKLNVEKILNYIKSKDEKIIKIFYLFYYLNLKISEIAEEMNMSISNVKNVLYRTIKDIKKNVNIEGDKNE